MGFCGLSLYASTVIAGVLTILASLCGIGSHGIFLASLNSTDKIDDVLDLLGHVMCPIDCNVLIPLEVSSIVANILWFFSAVILLCGNKSKNRGLLRPWMILTSLILVYEIAVLSYLVTVLQGDIKVFIDKAEILTKFGNEDHPFDIEHVKAVSSVYLILLYFRAVGPIWWAMVVASIIYVYQRGSEMKHKGKSKPSQPVISAYDDPSRDSMAGYGAMPRTPSREYLPPDYFSVEPHMGYPQSSAPPMSLNASQLMEMRALQSSRSQLSHY